MSSVTPILPISFGVVATSALAALAARRLRLPHSIVLVVLGLALAFVPGLPRVVLDPQLVLMILLPPLLYYSGVGMSWRGFKANLRPIMLLAVGCVLFTAVAVAATGHFVLGMPWSVGFVLGAVVSPPDAVAPMAIAKRLAVPSRILTVLEGEGLVNDATALILFTFALGAVASGTVSIPRAGATFAAIIAGELAFGIVMGFAALRIRKWADDAQVEMAFALLTPFATFWIPEILGGSGVLATVACGLYVSWNGPRYIAPATRLQGFFVWGLVVYLIESVVFLLTGLQARTVAESFSDHGVFEIALAATSICAAVIVVRFIWIFSATYLPRMLPMPIRVKEPAPPWQYSFMIGFTGIRGVVSLVAALSIPMTLDGEPFPFRRLILLVTFCVILVTLVGQGLSLPWLLRRLGLADVGLREAVDAKRREVTARIGGVDAALARLDELERDGAPPHVVASLRRHQMDRRKHLELTHFDLDERSPVAEDAMIHVDLVEAERQALARLYYADKLDDEARRRIERELDLEDARLRHAADGALARTE